MSSRMNYSIIKLLRRLIPISELLVEGLNYYIKPLKLVLSFIKLFFDLRDLYRNKRDI